MRCDICDTDKDVTSVYNTEKKQFDNLCDTCDTIIKSSIEELETGETMDAEPTALPTGNHLIPDPV